MSKEKKEKKENILDYPTSIDTRVALLEQSIGHINETLIRFEKCFDKIENEGKIHFRWTMVLIAGLYATIIGSLWTVIAKFVH